MVNDRHTSVRGTLRLQTLTMDGRVAYERSQHLTLPKNDAIHVYTLPLTDLLGGEQPEEVFFYITFETSSPQGRTEGGHYYNIAYPLRQKQMAYKRPNLTISCSPTSDGMAVTITTDIFARAVYLKTKGICDYFSDNYFDLLPGWTRTIHVRTSKPYEQFRQELEITSL